MSMKGQRRERGEVRVGGDRSGLSLLAVQSIVCGVVLLIVLLLRLIGGETWTQLSSLFRQWMTDEGLTQVVTEQESSETPSGTGERDLAVSDAVSVKQLPDGVTFSSLKLPTCAVFPLKAGTVTSSFGYRTDPIKGGTGFHTGVDISAPEGTALYAVCDGEVIDASWDDSYGHCVTIRCADGLEITYAHCSILLCQTGERVYAGRVVARVGSTGDSTGNHVHIMLSKDGVYYDPRPLIPEAWYA